MAAKATGESATYINKEKLKLNLNEHSDSLVQRAIKAQYEIMVQKAVNGIKKGLEEAGNKARSDDPIDIVISGGTASPPGFEKLFQETLEKSKLPLRVGQIIKPKDPLFSVARGALLAAEAADKS
jgi:cell division ATPase FtsA